MRALYFNPAAEIAANVQFVAQLETVQNMRPFAHADYNNPAVKCFILNFVTNLHQDDKLQQVNCKFPFSIMN